jgi:hypothetical protein
MFFQRMKTSANGHLVLVKVSKEKVCNRREILIGVAVAVAAKADFRLKSKI